MMKIYTDLDSRHIEVRYSVVVQGWSFEYKRKGLEGETNPCYRQEKRQKNFYQKQKLLYDVFGI